MNNIQDATEVAVNVYNLAVSVGLSHEAALKEAVTSSFSQIDKISQREFYYLLIERAENLDAEDHEEDSIFYDGVAALLSVAMELQDGVPLDDRVLKTASYSLIRSHQAYLLLLMYELREKICVFTVSSIRIRRRLIQESF